MSKTPTIGKSIWVTIWIVAMLQTIIGGTSPMHGERWRTIEFPGLIIALYLQWFLGPIPLLLGGSGGFQAVATVLSNVAIYAGFAALVLLFVKILRRES